VRVAAVVRDLIFGSRILEAASRAGAQLIRVDSPADLPTPERLDLVLVDWGDRSPEWGEMLVAWCRRAPPSNRPRLVLFGPHTDLEAHAEAKRQDLEPMLARSRLVRSLPSLMRGRAEAG
jgi:hypothetical protein